jgi:hypothetical protein
MLKAENGRRVTLLVSKHVNRLSTGGKLQHTHTQLQHTHTHSGAALLARGEEGSGVTLVCDGAVLTANGTLEEGSFRWQAVS